MFWDSRIGPHPSPVHQRPGSQDLGPRPLVAYTAQEGVVCQGVVRISRNVDRLHREGVEHVEEAADMVSVRVADIELVEREVVVDERRLDMESRQITMPVNRHSFSGRHSDVTPDFSAYVPARQIADDLGLTNRPQTYDLFDPDGRRASFSFRDGEGFSDVQEFTFIRKDLLDRYLKESGQRLAWAI